MKALLEKHLGLYTQKQNSLLSELFLLQKNHSVFVCDKLPLEDRAHKYIRAEQYPAKEGGKKFFSLAVEVEEKFWISWFNRTRIEKVGAIKWEFDGESFGGFFLEFHPVPYRKYKAEISRLAGALQWKFNCKVTALAVDNHQQQMLEVSWKK